ncbi:hypothetical protein EGR_06858 [Echinococcus granulosus]|uniref:Protein MIS12 homolog n=1 Tax=Echinococcus granulosus TaxID=6210 RepID=W6UCB8_ECHGR|nr:hypothetical protein EGR_06858 [Echinococcus granulosus]EUB58331.1 hypothetical protein EGR_06858 [Echinococcus granulosus]
MDSSCDVIEIPIEAAQEYVTTAIGFAPLNLSDLIYNIFTDNLCELVEKVVGELYAKYEKYLTQDKVDALKKMIKIKLQGQQNVLFDQFDNFIICDIFNIGDDVVLPDDIPQTTYSRKKHEWIKKSIGKYEQNLMLLNLVQKRIDQELANVKVLHDDLGKASIMIGDAIKSDFGGASEEFRLSVDALIHGRENVLNFLKGSDTLP